MEGNSAGSGALNQWETVAPGVYLDRGLLAIRFEAFEGDPDSRPVVLSLELLRMIFSSPPRDPIRFERDPNGSFIARSIPPVTEDLDETERRLAREAAKKIRDPELSSRIGDLTVAELVSLESAYTRVSCSYRDKEAELGRVTNALSYGIEEKKLLSAELEAVRRDLLGMRTSAKENEGASHGD